MAPTTLDPHLLETLLADDATLVRRDRVEAATRLVSDGTLPDADAIAAAVLGEFLADLHRELGLDSVTL